MHSVVASSSAAAMRRAISSSKANCMNATLSSCRLMSSDASVKQAAESKAIEVKPKRALLEANILSGAPPELTRHTARIYKPATPATQSGTAGSQYWKLDFDTQMKWENPLMGWASSADPVQALRINFDTKQEAIDFAERQGYDYWVEEPKNSHSRVKVYAENFTYSPGKLRMIRTK
ncbi:hypothetical protein BASA50_009476 [Batrachochytrium salamandrivorans]|uniref:NADH dehydrogenase [ubiquinone] iron-sulfur protein 4, mitochondrial n=1 Tax=Batrachochytrium salamandrivorans TaxID=1357716 RepID=A0ABQ8F1J2_9FUNG|nr:hypothetical protein BASA62_007742 [Batrachochytrium salamandrivorans]KAH6590214.1 hypothetical protein BASA50_009476 [Batrachochytrium salamandrivorans]KAH6602550.1 hypothetical protein BASA61_001007 [Batrachochytrium salamandrivorans]KAH9275146.1 hypothetical protein BASA83_002370 [Batrachochytrium salamandrivorans]